MLAGSRSSPSLRMKHRPAPIIVAIEPASPASVIESELPEAEQPLDLSPVPANLTERAMEIERSIERAAIYQGNKMVTESITPEKSSPRRSYAGLDLQMSLSSSPSSPYLRLSPSASMLTPNQAEAVLRVSTPNPTPSRLASFEAALSEASGARAEASTTLGEQQWQLERLEPAQHRPAIRALLVGPTRAVKQLQTATELLETEARGMHSVMSTEIQKQRTIGDEAVKKARDLRTYYESANADLRGELLETQDKLGQSRAEVAELKATLTVEKRTGQARLAKKAADLAKAHENDLGRMQAKWETQRLGLVNELETTRRRLETAEEGRKQAQAEVEANTKAFYAQLGAFKAEKEDGDKQAANRIYVLETAQVMDGKKIARLERDLSGAKAHIEISKQQMKEKLVKMQKMMGNSKGNGPDSGAASGARARAMLYTELSKSSSAGSLPKAGR